MRHRFTILLALAIVGCSSPSPVDTSVPPTVATEIDLRDPDMQGLLGAPPPQGITWQRSVGALTLSGKTSGADPFEVAVIVDALAAMPGALIDSATPRTLLRVHNGPAGAEETIANAIALTVGPDIYLTDETFHQRSKPPTRLEMMRVMSHELAHVAQFYSLDSEYVNRVLAGESNRISLTRGSALVAEFAAAVGWTLQEDEQPGRSWLLGDGAITPTQYGITDPGEDMAETVSLAVSGLSNWLDAERRTWVERWLDLDLDRANEGKPWVPAGAHQVLIDDPVFDQETALALAAANDVLVVETDSFSMSDGDIEEIRLSLESELELRGFAGTLGRVAGESVRFHGVFEHQSEHPLIVELIDFTDSDSDGPESLLLTYVTIR